MDANDDAQRDAVRLWRAWRTANEMCVARGYTILEEEYKVPFEVFRDRFCHGGSYEVSRDRLNFTAQPSPEMIAKHYNPKKPDEEMGMVYVEFNGDTSMGIKQLRTFAHKVDERQAKVGILVCTAAITASALKFIPAMLPMVVELFMEQDLLVNITEHELVPRHILMSHEEKAALLKRYRLKESQLPRLSVNDPVAKFLGLKKGQVVKIIRSSQTAGRYASYRTVL
ncbi:RPB5 subunit of DNA-directed RNA polymerase [Saccharata proteae CBS 121410]|uniref:DNA-directed RNA polymerases I, II, and III subunit RPABC1 n=1 Tax=Saccharata proteae CBS 121410 TaxID=1314787 RepID=A0A9P4HLF6_9PEZI|nr:RPB5 subunit of DNA-directed RNA polymerase [Saccharata proteae CBS 121410]